MTDTTPAVKHAQRAAGQMAGIATMIREGRSFGDVSQQILAARGSLDSLLVRLVQVELDGCVSSPTARSEVDLLIRSALGRAAHGCRRNARLSGGASDPLTSP